MRDTDRRADERQSGPLPARRRAAGREHLPDRPRPLRQHARRWTRTPPPPASASATIVRCCDDGHRRRSIDEALEQLDAQCRGDHGRFRHRRDRPRAMPRRARRAARRAAVSPISSAPPAGSLQEPKVRLVDLTEFDPSLDVSDITALTAAPLGLRSAGRLSVAHDERNRPRSSPVPSSQAMRRVAATVNVISICVDGQPMGITATAVSVAVDGPAEPARLRQPTATRPCADGRACRHFRVNVLHRDQAEVATIFADRKLEALRFITGWDNGLRDAAAAARRAGLDPLPPHRSSPLRHPFDLHRRGRGGVRRAPRSTRSSISTASSAALLGLRPTLRTDWRDRAIALISSALPEGSRKNIVACSPGSPRNRTVGGIAKSTPAASAAPPALSQSAMSSTAPKCGTGTSWPSTALLPPPGAGAGDEMGDDLVAEEIEIDPFVASFAPRGSRAARRRRRARRRGRGPERRDGRAAWLMPLLAPSPPKRERQLAAGRGRRAALSACRARLSVIACAA